MVSFEKRDSGIVACSYSHFLTSSFVMPPLAAVAACSGPNASTGCPA
jgi:hypothetical protein